MAMDMNMTFTGAGTGMGTGLEAGAAGVGQTGGVTGAEPSNTSSGAKLQPLLQNPSLTVTAYTEMERMVMESSYETSKHIIDNMVDTPEERAEKAARAKERRRAEDDTARREEDIVDKDVQETRVLDEIQTKREEKI